MLVGERQIKAPTFHKHLVSREHRRAARRRNFVLGLTLTSMVDMFSLLVIFLLQTFSASPEMLIVQKGVTLPQAATGKELKDAPLLSLSDEGVFLDQKKVGSLDGILKEPTPLMERLEELRTVWLKTHPKEKFPGEINLQAHKELPSSTVAAVMAMLPSQAFGSIQLAVVSGGN